MSETRLADYLDHIGQSARDALSFVDGMSKDNDFRQLSFLRGTPPKVVWLRIGNGPTKAVVELLRSRKADLESFARDAETALLTIQMEHDYP
jgi:predicted nuclease of predicted toxin-antitoxin system